MSTDVKIGIFPIPMHVGNPDGIGVVGQSVKLLARLTQWRLAQFLTH